MLPSQWRISSPPENWKVEDICHLCFCTGSCDPASRHDPHQVVSLDTKDALSFWVAKRGKRQISPWAFTSVIVFKGLGALESQVSLWLTPVYTAFCIMQALLSTCLGTQLSYPVLTLVLLQPCISFARCVSSVPCDVQLWQTFNLRGCRSRLNFIFSPDAFL